ncbi:histidine kinase [Cellulomonas xiejunii]|uniref:Histidine kinase n=1 Tax=Cellulomonas xiejunii TaxID=2968083 RepID=A0ABY5KMQ1_9CELL|nr:histidine kinase [Cellulomonas xiejunii]MCC2316175.1 histidine kinase [Cellulomonas xiejunii]MCC2320762.1 histidine kinase [Cellulomonas xiejunii]UUI71049.1 histidine kinase [Cellulomonas xiejunii]
MPDDPRPADDARPDDATAATPDEAELARVAVPATVRRAPRYGAFIVAGALVGVVVGLVVAVVSGGDGRVTSGDGGVLPFLAGQNGVRWVLALAAGVVGAFVGGGLAVLADRRSTRRRRAAPQD